MKILAIGNSFSQDELTFLHQIAKSAGMDASVANLYIGGCSLETHMTNIKNNAPLYEYQENGFWQGEYISIDDALLREKWDIVYTHQASALAGIEWTYRPYLKQLISHVSALAPQAKMFLDETWAYEFDSDHEGFAIYGRSQKQMHKKVAETCKKIAKEHELSLIPCGSALEEVRSMPEFDYEHGGMSLHRDGFHMHLIYGRYLMGCVLYEYLCGGNILDSSFIPHDTEVAPADMSLIDKIKNTVHRFMQSYCS